MVERADAELAQLDPDDLWKQVGSRLRTLPPDAYLRCLAYFSAEYRRLYHQNDLPGEYIGIIDRIVALAAQAAVGVDAARRFRGGRASRCRQHGHGSVDRAPGHTR
jgi:hypothetical protein